MTAKYILKTKTLYGVSVVDEKGGELSTFLLMNKTKKEIMDFIKLCNSEGLEPIHLKDAITDMLYD